MTRFAHSYRATAYSYRAAAALGATLLLISSGALAGGPPTTTETPEDTVPPIDMTADWPCVQHKVDTVSVAQVWDGPPIEAVKGWYKEKGLPDLIELLASRRIPVEQAEAAIKTYAEAQPEDQRDQKLTLLFAGLFDAVLSQRRSVVSGIEKYQKSQIARAQELEQQSTAIAKLEGDASTKESPQLDQAREKFNWAQRIFQERQQSIPLACELPVLIEERLYAVAHSIRSLMKS